MMKKCSAILMAGLLTFSAMLPSFSSAEDVIAESAFEKTAQVTEAADALEGKTGSREESGDRKNGESMQAPAEKETPASTQTPPADTPKPTETPRPAETSEPAETLKTAAETKAPDASLQTGSPEEPEEVTPEETKETDAAAGEPRHPDQGETEVLPEASEVPAAADAQGTSGAEAAETAGTDGEPDTAPESSEEPTEKSEQDPSEGDSDLLPEFSEGQESKEGGTEGEPAADNTEEGSAAETDPAPMPESSQLATATGLKLTSTGLTSMTLTFQGDPSPTKYRVYRATSKNGKYSYLGLAWEPAAGEGTYYYEDLTAKKNVTYYYKVRAYISVSGEKTWGKKYSAVVSGRTKPAAAEKVTGKSTAAKTIKISWTAVKGATGYQVARSTNLYSGYTVLKTVTSGATVSYSDKTAKTGRQYYYRVRAFYAPASGSRIYGPYTYSSVILCQPVAPKNFKISAQTDTSVTFSWTAAADIEYYQLSWSWKQDGVTQRDEAVVAKTKTSYKVKDLAAGTDYTFEMRSIAFSTALNEMRSGVAVCKYTTPAAAEETPKSGDEAASGGESEAEQAERAPEGEEATSSAGGGDPEGLPEGRGTAQSGASSENEAAGALEQEGEETVHPAEEPETGEGESTQLIEKEEMVQAPEISDVSVDASGITVKWASVPGAESYTVYRSGKQTSGYKLMAKGLAEPIWMDTSAAQYTGYYYKVTAVDADGNKLVSEPKGAFDALGPKVTAKKGSDGYYTLTWGAVKNADQYRVYRSVNGGAYERVKTVSAGSTRSWKDTGVQAGMSCAYYIRPCKKVDGKVLFGAKGAVKTVFVGVKNNPELEVSQEPSKITLSWSKVSNASGYAVYGAAGDEKLKLLATVSSKTTSWSQTPPAASGYLKYYVRAYYKLGTTKNYAPKSDPTVIRRLAAPQITISRGSGENTIAVSWSKVSGAKTYRVYYRTEAEEEYTYLRTEGLNLEIPAPGGQKTYVYVRAELQEEVTSVGSRSAVKTMTPYWKFALLIGNSQYTEKSSLSKLAATAADVAGFSVVLDKQNGWKVNACANMTGSEILSAISRFFSGADQNCTCLFYYSGHGQQTRNDQTGSLCGIDGAYVTTAQLKAALGKYPGKSIVLLDSCGSGAAVENESGAATLTGENTSVITAAAAYQTSWATPFYSYFTYFLSYGSGYDAAKQAALSSQPADTNKDGVITFQEISLYIAKYLTAMSEARGVTQTAVWSLPEPGASIY